MERIATPRTDFARGRPPRRRGLAPLAVEGVTRETLAPMMRGRRVLVVGSAPLATPIGVPPEPIVVAVNGSISSVPAVTPDLWLLNARLGPSPGWNRTRRWLNAKMLEQARGRHVGTICLLPVQDEAEAATVGRLKDLGVTFDRLVALAQSMRGALQYEVGAFRKGIDNKVGVSAGVLGTLLALWAGASHVRQLGFSYGPGYAYLPPADVPENSRGHKRADRLAIWNLRRVCPARISGDLITRGYEAPTALQVAHV